MYIEAAATALEVGKLIFDNRSPLKKGLRKLKSFLKNGRVRIAVFGLGGIGKTTLGDLLSGKMVSGIPTGGYKLSYRTDEVSIKGDHIASLIVPGGQQRRIDNDWPGIYRMLADGKSKGIINVVAWGYHSFTEIGYKETKYYGALTKSLARQASKEEFLSYYTNIKRKEEIENIKELVPHLKIAKEKVWMITLVTKQDLWWGERVQVKAHYDSGEYADVIQNLASARGQQNFAHELISASLVMSNLQTNDGEVLVPTAAGYDQNLQYANLSNLLSVVNSFIVKRS